MRTPVPLMTAEAATLQQRRQRERDGRKTSRLPRLYWRASGHAPTRQDVAQLLGVHRHPMGHGRAMYAAGGREAWVALDVPAGKPLSRPPAGLAALEPALRRPAGLASYAALRQGITPTQRPDGHDHTL
jgi:hypothetical protein